MWKVVIKKKIAKGLPKLPLSVVELLKALSKDLKANGPQPGERWHNYSKLGGKSIIATISTTDMLLVGK